jgi:uncharacterized protein YyaL (SSP411 family)
MSNRLARETSPYLLQHKDNPVDWQAWGPEALAEARERDVPLLISIGYSACHWCHVMERESFEDPDTAALMNELFVPIKVDREERPDVDAIYMEAVQAMTGQGGWPLNAFATPDQVPFFAGTYFPPAPRPGMPSWRQVLQAVSDAWNERRDEIVEQGERVRERLGTTATLQPSGRELDPATLDAAVRALADSYDDARGGFGGAPKFPPASTIEFLLGRGETRMSVGTLNAMARGGIYDQIGGGFARYAVDATWTVPHFEKMLYDNALLARAYLHGFQVTGDPFLRRVAEETLDWALHEMRGPEGGFYSALDADSEGVEGRYYVWTAEQLRATLGELADEAIAHFGVTEAGNFEGANILTYAGPEPERLAEIRGALLLARAERVRPGLDDKRLTSWNALMISALADAGAVLERADYVEAAVAAADFVLRDLRDEDGRLLRTYNAGRAHVLGYLEDHAFLLEALLTLYEATFDERWFDEARALGDVLIERFADRERGGFFTTADDHEALIARRKDLEDHPIPAGSSSAALGLLRLGALTGEARYEEAGRSVLDLVHPIATRHPTAFGHALQALQFAIGPVREVAIVGPEPESLLQIVRARFRPTTVLAGGVPDDAPAARSGEPGRRAGGIAAGVPLLEGRTPVDGRAAAYVCERFVCQRPVTDPTGLATALGDVP